MCEFELARLRAEFGSDYFIEYGDGRYTALPVGGGPGPSAGSAAVLRVLLLDWRARQAVPSELANAADEDKAFSRVWAKVAAGT